MLDLIRYRTQEKLAKINDFEHWEAHFPKHFEEVKFPNQIDNISDLGQIIDTMQENRFNNYMAELQGLTEQEFQALVLACRDLVDFQLCYLPHQIPILPLSTIMSAFCLYLKMYKINSLFSTVLEIGPGCGYLSFLLKRHRNLTNYSQIESCESFYLLQNLVNTHCFGIRFCEKAVPIESGTYSWPAVSHQPNIDLSPRVIQLPKAKCSHYPWWRIPDMENEHFELITSNANLLEFNPEALDTYLNLIYKILEPNGYFIIQCLGYVKNLSVDSLIEKIKNNGFSLVANTVLAVQNWLLVKDTAVAPSSEFINHIYSYRPLDRRIYNPQDFIKEVEVNFANQ